MVDGPTGDRDKTHGPVQYAARTAGSAWEVDGGVVVEGVGLRPGALVPVRITGAAAYDLLARVDSHDNLILVGKGPD
jgi:hypothetical protein